MRKALQRRDRKRAIRARMLARHRRLFALMARQDLGRLMRDPKTGPALRRLAKQGRRKRCRPMMALPKIGATSR